MDAPTRNGRAALAAGGATLAIAVVVVSLGFGTARGSGVSAATTSPSPTATTTPSPTSATPTPSRTATATSTPAPVATTSAAPVGPPPTLAAPFGPYQGGVPYAGGEMGYLPYANPPGAPDMAPPGYRRVDGPPGQRFRYRMYTCTNYEPKADAPTAYHCVPEIDPAVEEKRYYGFYGQNPNNGNYGVPQGQPAYPPGSYPTQPYYSTPPTTTFATCEAARAAGYSTIPRGSTGYSTALDRDNDGIACETGE